MSFHTQLASQHEQEGLKLIRKNRKDPSADEAHEILLKS